MKFLELNVNNSLREEYKKSLLNLNREITNELKVIKQAIRKMPLEVQNVISGYDPTRAI